MTSVHVKMKEKRTNKVNNSKGISYGAAGLTLSGGHALFCPAHGIIPNYFYIGAATGSALTEYAVAKPFVWLHEKQIHFVDEMLEFTGFEERPHSQERFNLEALVQYKGRDYHHHSPRAEPIVSGANYLLMACSLYLFGKGLYNRFRGASR